MHFGKKSDLSRFISLPLLVLMFFLLNATASEGALSCTITTSCTNTCVFRMYPQSDGHAELCSETNYNNVICCTAPGETLTINSGTGILNLLFTTNSHVEFPTLSNYPYKVYLGSQGRNVVCSYKTTCSADEACLASIASDTNSHVASCNYFSTNICCKTTTGITIEHLSPINNSIVQEKKPAFKWKYFESGVWNESYEATSLPNTPPWNRYVAGSYSEIVSGGALHLSASGTSYIYYDYPDLNLSNSVGTTLDARLKIYNSSSGWSNLVYINDGVVQEGVVFYVDGIQLYFNGASYAMDTTDYHVYRFVVQGSLIKVYVDGVLRINAVGGGAGSVKSIQWGIYQPGGVASSNWDYVRYANYVVNESSSGYTYDINITNSNCPAIYQTGITTNSFTPSANLCRDNPYKWSVRAYDGISYSDWSDFWNFTVQTPAITVNLEEPSNNNLTVFARRPAFRWRANDPTWNASYFGNVLPEFASPPWPKYTSGTYAENLGNGILSLSASGTSYIYYDYRDSNLSNSAGTTIEARLKVTSSGTGWSNLVYVNDGIVQEGVVFYVDGIHLYFNGASYAMDTTTYHVYRFVVQGSSVKVYVDGVLRIDAVGGGAGGVQSIQWGVHQPGTTASSEWDYLRYANYAFTSTAVTYDINITNPGCPQIYQSGISDLLFKPATDLCTDSFYSWKVRAYDGTDYHPWSDTWSFIVESAVIINLTVNSTNFGIQELNATDDTTDNSPQPLQVVNIGNVLSDIGVWSTALWTTKPLNTHYYQFSAGNDSSTPGSFNWNISQNTWANMSSVEKTVIRQLNFNQSNKARIHLRITVPIDEAAGAKTSTIYVSGVMS